MVEDLTTVDWIVSLRYDQWWSVLECKCSLYLHSHCQIDYSVVQYKFQFQIFVFEIFHLIFDNSACCWNIQIEPAQQQTICHAPDHC